MTNASLQQLALSMVDLVGVFRLSYAVTDQLGTVDFVKGDALVFRTAPEEKGHLVFQIGTASAQLALEAARKVYVFTFPFGLRSNSFLFTIELTMSMRST